jgi:predicted RNA-binding protein YlxR (DUF448 family)
MVTRPNPSELDLGPRQSAPERLCVATRSVKPVADMIRFVVAPDGAVVPDVKHKLPGRGVWVTARRTAVEAAVVQKAFRRSFRREASVSPDLAAITERMLERSALDGLAVAYKAGRVVVGFAKVEAALAAVDPVAGLIHAAGCSQEGVRKLAAALRRCLGKERPVVIDMFTSAQLDLALGRSNVIHAAVLAGPASAGFFARYRSLERFRSQDPGAEGSGGGRGMP